MELAARTLEFLIRLLLGVLSYLGMSLAIAEWLWLAALLFWILFASYWLIGKRRLPPKRAAALAFLAPAVLILMTTLPFYIWAHVPYRVVNQSASPDGKFVLVVESRPDFPMSEMIDPISDIRVTLSETDSTHPIRIEALTVKEDSDACQSCIIWAEDTVTVDFGRSVTRTIEFGTR